MACAGSISGKEFGSTRLPFPPTLSPLPLHEPSLDRFLRSVFMQYHFGRLLIFQIFLVSILEPKWVWIIQRFLRLLLRWLPKPGPSSPCGINRTGQNSSLFSNHHWFLNVGFIAFSDHINVFNSKHTRLNFYTPLPNPGADTTTMLWTAEAISI